MIINEAEWERIIRVVVGVVLIATGILAPYADHPWSYVISVIGAVLVATGLIGYCPAWHLLGISTAKKGGRN